MDQLSGGLRLLVDLLLHEVGVPTLFRSIHPLGEHFRLSLDDLAITQPPQLDAVVPQADHLAVLQAKDLVRDREDRGEVRRHARRSVSDPNDKA